MRVAIVHDWLLGMRGGEKVLDCLCKIFPESEIFTLVYEKGTATLNIEKRQIHTSFLQLIPNIVKNYRNYLPLFPLAIESFNFEGFDLIISSSHCVAKGAKRPKNTPHICYCHTPMRYVWVFFEQYFGSYPKWKKELVRISGEYLRKWDISTLNRVDEFIANSHTIKNRIQNVYNRDSAVIYPPVAVDKFNFNVNRKRGDFYLCVSSLVPYKRVDIIIEAFNKMKDKRLVIVGDGNSRKELEALKVSSNITFAGWVSQDELTGMYEGAKAFVFAAEEDFGIAPVEAQALGLPVIVYGKGGTTETVIPINGPSKSANPTGLFFFEQSADLIVAAINEFEKIESEFDPLDCRKNAERFSEERFVNSIKGFVNEKMRLLRPVLQASQ